MKFGKRIACLVGAAALWATLPAPAQVAKVTGQVTVAASDGSARVDRDTRVVVWLTPLTDHGPSPQRASGDLPHPTLVQKNKHFDPHVLVVEVGSQVDFPNHDPFFHNVFSLFNGERFDLGLYEAGAVRSVHFDRAGICYIFCNIHPQMSAIVVVVDTPYFAAPDGRGEITIPNVPAGRYHLSVWEERCTPQDLKELSRQVTVGEGSVALGNIHLQESAPQAMVHLNKYGKQYDPPVFSSPIYVQP